ncbi:MAG: response regulator [Cyanobacteria bacterium P01_D01_bin.105]
MASQFKLSRIGQSKSISRMVPGLLASVVVLVLMQMNVWAGIERQINTQMMLWRGQLDWDSRIVMISIDDPTLEAYGAFPITRNAYADLLWLMKKEDASVVAFNVSFSDASALNRTFRGQAVNPASRSAENANLASAIQAHGRVVLGQSWDENGNPEIPVPVLANTALAIGHLQLAGARVDGQARRVYVTYEGMPALGVATTQAYSLNQVPLSVPSEQNYLTINWPASGRNLTTLSLVDVLRGNFPAGFFKSKIVIVSYGASVGPVEIETPFDQRSPASFADSQIANGPSVVEPRSYQKGRVQSGYLHAAVIHNLLQQSWLRQVPEQLLAVCVLLAGPGFSGLLYRRRTSMRLLLCFGLFFGWLLLGMLALYVNYLLPMAVPLATLTLVGVVVSVLGRLESNALLQVRSAFLNTMSHEIRTPLNAIVNLSEMLQETQLDSRQREFAETLNTSSHTLLALINDVLDFSKIESGRLMIDECPVRLSEMVERSLEMLAPRAADKGLELGYSMTPSTPAVIVSDPVRLQQILLNLLSNAVKFTDVGEISVQVQAMPIATSRGLFPWQQLSSMRQRASQLKRVAPYWRGDTLPRQRPTQTERLSEKAGLYEIRFAVHDTGIGIPPERMSQLFKPFSQVSAATTRKYGGTGLGLSISKRLSERLGGNLWVRSYPGEGSTFYFTVQTTVAEVNPQPPSYLKCLSGTRLLLIDRNITRRNHFTWQLQPLGISLAQATSLSEALSFMQSDPTFDGIVLDEAVAKTQEGCAIAIQTLRRTARNEQLPVILLSTLQTAQHQAPVPDLLVKKTVTLWKPVKQAALYHALQSISPTPFATLSLPASSLSAPSLSTPSLPTSSSSLSMPSLLAELADEPAGLPSQPPRAEATNGQDRCAKLKILIAEDNRINQKVAMRLLERLGYGADIADTGLAVLEALERQCYDVILMDMRMPELDGLETTRTIRQMAQHANIWIIAMTANATARDQQMCFAAGMNDYLSKPINRGALELALLRCPVASAG